MRSQNLFILTQSARSLLLYPPSKKLVAVQVEVLKRSIAIGFGFLPSHSSEAIDTLATRTCLLEAVRDFFFGLNEKPPLLSLTTKASGSPSAGPNTAPISLRRGSPGSIQSKMYRLIRLVFLLSHVRSCEPRRIDIVVAFKALHSERVGTSSSKLFFTMQERILRRRVLDNARSLAEIRCFSQETIFEFCPLRPNTIQPCASNQICPSISRTLSQSA